MSFRGLFIGIDRYQSPAIGDLSCAGRDATALNALFMDTLGGVPTLLTDAEATRHRIAVEFSALAGCDLDDTVIIGFSGHGSETHELVPYDADIAPCRRPPYRSTCSKIGFPTFRPVVFFLDCCFSGGFGSKVLQVDLKPRNLRSAESKLARIAGDGRIAGRISVYRLLDHVTARVSAVAAQFGLQQHPTMRGKDRRRRALADLCRGPALRGGVPPSPTRRRHGRPDEPPERGLPSSTDRGVVERNPLAERTSGRRSEVQLRDKPESQNPPPRRPRRQRKPERIGR
jgi:hypothetical protein